MNINHFGTLYIVATPIGNLNDISRRAIDTLSAVNCIAAEDTRYSTLLLQHLNIRKPIFSLHEHNEQERAGRLLEQLQGGESIALISDAGTPLISDPGYFLVREARNRGIKVMPIPGPCAIITALSASGLPTDRFGFEGFLPAKSKARLERLQGLRSEVRTLIFYEAPHRVLACLQDMQKVFGADRAAVIARELTKLYETIHNGTLAQLIDWVEQDANQQRGEIVLIIAGSESPKESTEAIATETVLQILIDELPLRQATELAAKILGKRKNELYQQALRLKGQSE